MLTPDQCRKLDPSLNGLPDDELESVLATLYGIGHLAFDSWKNLRPNVSKYPPWVAPDLADSDRI